MENTANDFLDDLEALLRQYRMCGFVHSIKKERYGQFKHKDKCGMKFEFKLEYL